MKSGWRLLAAVCALVIGVYLYMSLPGDWEKFGLQNAADSPYNLLVQGFRTGQLSLKKEVPPGFLQLADPYDPVANEIYRFSPPYLIHDLCYYKGRLYLYHGVTPALILFWPYAVLTGEYLSHQHAVMIFCAIGFLASMGLLCAVWRRYFPEVSVVVVLACAIALGLATGALAQLSQAGLYQVARTCGYMLAMLALVGIWCALQDPERGWRWLAAASTSYGLAVGARPDLLFGALALLVPVAQAWRKRRSIWAVLTAATVPITLIGLGLILYNELRFDKPFEFGWRYQLNLDRQITRQPFSPHFLWLNFRVYFLEPARWSARFPFVHEAHLSAFPTGYTQVTRPFGILANNPLTWLALAAPLAWRGRTDSNLRWFVVAVTLLFGTCAFTLGLFCASNFDYEVDFLPSLLLLAVIGILGLERALANRPVWQRATRCGWSVLLGFSVAFNLLATADHYAEAHTFRGDQLRVAGKHLEAIEEYEHALRIEPDDGRAHNSLGYELLQAGKISEAIWHFEQSLRISPDGSEAHDNLGSAFERQGRMLEAREQYEQAVQIDPGNSSAQNNLANALVEDGKLEDAVRHYEEALQLKPDLAEAHCNLGITLARAGRIPEAIEHLEQAVRLNPNLMEAQKALSRLQARQSTY